MSGEEGKQEALPICPDCGAVFNTQRGLSSHRKVHQAPVMCPQCGETVKYLVPHLRKRHAEVAEHQALVDGVKALIDDNVAMRNTLARARLALVENRLTDAVAELDQYRGPTAMPVTQGI